MVSGVIVWDLRMYEVIIGRVWESKAACLVGKERKKKRDRVRGRKERI